MTGLRAEEPSTFARLTRSAESAHAAEVANVGLPDVHLRINGKKVLPQSGQRWEHVNPATGQVDATVPLADAAAVDDAVLSAHAAFEAWRRTAPARRRDLLVRLADLMVQHGDEIVRLGIADNGRPVRSGAALAALAADWTRYYAGWADKIIGDVTGTPTQDGELGFTMPQPYGVVGLVITWNAPFMSIVMKAPAALAAGNTVVIKPSELTPFTGELFMDLVEEAGFPPGVVNLLPGTADAGNRLVTHPLVKKVSFTGALATAIANSTRYGLSSYVQTRDLTRAHRIAAELEAGEVLINGAPSLAAHRPFGGIGISGVGKEGGQAGFEEFLRIKSVAIATR